MDGCAVMRRGERRRRRKRRRRRLALRNLGWLCGCLFPLIRWWEPGGLLVVKEVCFLCWFRRIFMRLIVYHRAHAMECIGCRWLSVNVRRAMLMRAGCGM